MPNDTSDPDDPPPALREYEARRCHICGRAYPSFGFGPPLRKADQVLWACGEHRAEVAQIASGPAPWRRETERRLL